MRLMERSVVVSPAFSPSEREIEAANSKFPTKGHLSPTGRAQKWADIRAKLTSANGFLAHIANPELELVACDDVRGSFDKCHLSANVHRSWEDTWKQISSTYQTNSKRFGVPQAVFGKLFDECGCQDDVHTGDTVESDVHTEDTVESDVHTEDTVKRDVHTEVTVESDVHTGDTVESDVHTEDTVESDVHTEDTVESDVHTEDTVESDLHTEDTVESDVHTGDTVESDVHTEDTVESDVHTGDTVESDVHTEDTVESDVHTEDTVESDVHTGDTVESDVHTEDTVESDVHTEDTVESDVHTEDTVESDVHTEVTVESDVHTKVTVEGDIDASNTSDGPKFNLFSHLGLSSSTSHNQSPLKRKRKLTKNDFETYEVPRDKLDEHMKSLDVKYSSHMVLVKVKRNCTFRRPDGTTFRGTLREFGCHRHDAPSRKRQNKRKRGSKMVGCTFCVKVAEADDEGLPIQLRLHSAHTNRVPGSKEDQKFLPVDKRVVDIANDCLDAGLHIQQSVNIILNVVKSGTIGEIDKCRYRATLTRKELTKLQHQRRRQHRLSDDDWFSTYTKLEEYQSQGKCIFFQKYDPENADSDRQPFVAVLQTDWQMKMAERFTPNSAWSMDSTFGLNSYGLPLFTATVPNQNKEGIPLFFLITSADKNTTQEETGIKVGFTAVLQNLKVRPNAIVIDKSLTEKRGIQAAVDQDPLSWDQEHSQQTKCRLILCWFHCKKAWTENLLPKLPTDISATVYDQLCDMMFSPTWDKYEEEKKRLLDSKTTHKSRSTSADTTNLTEREWMTIKYTILNGRANHRVDTLLDALVGHPVDGSFQGGQTTIAFHMNKQDEADMGFNTKSLSKTQRTRQENADLYMAAYMKDPSVITLVNQNLPFFRIKSTSVQGLSHTISLTEQFCSCQDNAAQGQTCKHILAAQTFVEKYHPSMTSTIMPPDLHKTTLAGSGNENDLLAEEQHVQSGTEGEDCRSHLHSNITELEEALDAIKTDIPTMSSYQLEQTSHVVKTCLRQLPNTVTIEKPQTKDQRVTATRLMKSIQLSNVAARRKPKASSSTRPAGNKTPAVNSAKRMKVKQVHKRVRLPGKYSAQFKRVSCDNCGINTFVGVSKKVNNPNIIEKTTVVPGISDHDMVLVDVNLALKQNRKPKRKVYIRTKADEPAIKKDLTDYATNFHKRTQDMSVTQKWSDFKDKMKDTMNKHIPSKITSSRYNLPWFNRNLRRHCRKKQRLYNKAKKTGQEEDWNKYKRVKKGVQKSIRQAHSKYVADILGEAIVDKPKTFWSYIKGLRKDLVGVAPLKVGNTIISDTSGPDQIPPWFLKFTASEIAPVLTNIFQHSLNTADIPKDWRDANICAIFKKGDRAVPSNYRPVSLTCISCKLLEHIIHSQIMKHLESYSILTDYQHGFRAKRSTETQLILTVHDIAGALNSKRQVDLAILDFTKAFDKVPHGRLISKLEYYGIQGPTLNWLKAFLTNREQTVVVEGKATAPVKVASGVPQGTVLGPLLFLLYINDLPDQLDSNVRLFADDCLLYVELSTQTDSQLLQKDLNTLEEWQSKWLMQFNPEKCYIMHITNKRTPHATSYQFCGQALATTKIHPYLGVTLTSGLKLPRSVSAIAVCGVYIPPDSPHQDVLVDHLTYTTDTLRTKYPDIGIVVLGDLNRTDTTALCRGNRLKQVVNQPTRGDVVVDVIITNIYSQYGPPVVGAPVGRSDHNSVLWTPVVTRPHNKSHSRVVRPLKDSDIRAFGTWITKHSWQEVYTAQSTQEKTDAFYETLTSGIDHFFPTKTVKIHSTDKAWITPAIKRLIRKRQEAFNQQNDEAWKRLRNKVNHSIKLAKKAHYGNKVQGLKQENTSKWYKELKAVCNIAKPPSPIHVPDVDPANQKAVADGINKHLSSVSQQSPPICTRDLPAYLPAPSPPPQIQPWENVQRTQQYQCPEGRWS
ncbi:hypothetical protein Bbelb_293010 [Branchiostoma belcheri]|nr:hypothetical protein Bbelb_293010 [Branchiostoma belcheri]